MQRIITGYDYLLLPFYLIVFYLIVRWRAKKYTGTPLRKFFLLTFWLHMAGAIFISLLMQYYYGSGDPFNYYNGGDLIRSMIVKDISGIKYLFYSAKDLISKAEELGYADKIPVIMVGDSNAFVMKIAAIISFFSFNQFLITSLFFGFFSFIGSWKLFYVLQKINGDKHIQILGYSTICTPSIWIWGSGLLKEPVCVFALGVGFFAGYRMYVNKRVSIKNLLLLVVLFYIVIMVKSYIIVVFLVSVLIVFFITMFSSIKKIIWRIAATIVFLFVIIISLININVDSYLDDIVQSSFYQIENFKNSYESVQADYENSKAGFSIGDIKPTLSSLLANSPAVIASCLFRPFIWESRKIIILFSALEASAIFLGTLFVFFKTKFLGFFYYAFNNPFRQFCFIFSMLFALLVGYTTFNFGTMVRYKIIFLPFYFFLLINIYTAMESKKNNPAAKQ